MTADEREMGPPASADRKSRKREARELVDGPDLTIREINRQLSRKQPFPFRRFVLFSGGAPLKLLRIVPVEETEFLVKGTGVLIAAAMAGLGTALASRMFTPPPSHYGSVAIGLAAALFIYSIDRMLVRGSLRPHVFPPDVLTTLWDPYADAKWYEVISRSGGHAQSALSRVRGFFTVFAKIFIRLLLAGFISYIVADVLAIAIFKPAVDDRARAIKIQERDELAANAKDAKEARDEEITAQQQAEQTIQDNVPAVKGASSQLQEDKDRVTALAKDVSLLQGIINAEINGNRIPQVTLSDTTKFPADKPFTSGRANCEDLCHQAQAKQATVREDLSRAKSDVSTDRHAYNRALKHASAVDLVAKYRPDFRASHRQYKEDLKAIPKSVTPNDILIRRVALHQLEHDAKPWTVGLDAAHSCSAGWGWLCGAKQAVIPGTPLGSFVGALRATLFLIDTLPITLAMYFALRGRRPFDALIAALEEASVADSINKLDHELNHSGQQMEDRAVARRGHRHTAGARILRERLRARARDAERSQTMARRDVDGDYAQSVVRDRPSLARWLTGVRSTHFKSRRTREIFVVDRTSSPWQETDSYRNVKRHVPRQPQSADVDDQTEPAGSTLDS